MHFWFLCYETRQHIEAFILNSHFMNMNDWFTTWLVQRLLQYHWEQKWAVDPGLFTHEVQSLRLSAPSCVCEYMWMWIISVFATVGVSISAQSQSEQQSVFEVLCCCNIGGIQVGEAPSLPYPCETAVWCCQNWRERGGAGLITH